MANQEHLAILKQGIEVWNEWRQKNPKVKPDLSGANLEYVNLQYANLDSADLNKANLTGANLNAANLNTANLNTANLTGADLNKANLTGANLIIAFLSSANLKDVNLTGANLQLATLNNATLNNVTLRGANLENADLSNADLTNANLTSAFLTGAFLIDANLIGVALENANLRGASLINANLSHATLSNASLINADLTNSNFSNANLNHVDLFDADLRGADFESANLCGANLALTKAIGSNLVGATLTGACIQYWNIDAHTNLQNVVCDYVFMEHERKGKDFYYTDRRPHDPNQNFVPDEFTKRYQKVLDSVDLFFNDGIDWRAFLATLQELQAQYGADNLVMQGMEQKSGGGFEVHLAVSPQIDKGLIERQAKEKYETQLQLVEAQYRIELKDMKIEHQNEIITLERRHNSVVEELAKLKANQPITHIEKQYNIHNFKAGGGLAIEGGQQSGGALNDYNPS
jgi:uncharacterized protein YjbI with pentapeptide repeats